MKSVKRWCSHVVLITLMVVAGEAWANHLPLHGTPNPDPSRIVANNEGGFDVTAIGPNQAVVVHPLAGFSPYQEDILANNISFATEDVRNVQWAVQNAVPDGTVRLLAGTFDFGFSALYLPGVDLVGDGEDENDDPLSIITGGAGAIRTYFLSPGDKVKIKRLWIQDAILSAILAIMTEFDRLEVTNTKVTGVIGVSGLIPDLPDFLFRASIGGFGNQAVPPFTGDHAPRCAIDQIVVRDSEIDNLPPSPQITFGDSNGVEFVQCTYSSIKIRDNILKEQGEPIELLSNFGPSSKVVIDSNTIVMGGETQIGFSDGDPSAVYVAANEGAVRITDNDIEVINQPSAVGMLMSQLDPAAQFIVRDNSISMESGFAVMNLGFPAAPAFGAPFESQLTGALIDDNEVSGSARNGIVAGDVLVDPFGPPFTNQASNNLFVDNDFEDLTVSECHVALGPATSDNVFEDNEGLPLDCDLGMNNIDDEGDDESDDEDDD